MAETRFTAPTRFQRLDATLAYWCYLPLMQLTPWRWLLRQGGIRKWWAVLVYAECYWWSQVSLGLA